MKTQPVLYTLVFGLLAATQPLLGQDQCSEVQARLNARLAEISSNLEQRTAARKKQMEKDINKLQEDAPHPDGDPLATVKLHFKVTSHNQDIILGLPDVTIKDQTMILKLPEVRLNDQTWSWDRPAVRMVNVQTGEYPEFTCQGLSCSVKWSPIITSVPQPYMVREQVILGVPEFAMRDQKIIMGVPEFSIRQQKIVLTIPDFTLENIEAQTDYVKKSSNDISQKMQKDMNDLVAQSKAEMEKDSVTEISNVYACQGQQLEQKEKAALAEIDKQRAVIQSSLDTAQRVGAGQMAAQMQDTLTKLDASRAEVVKQFAAARTQLAESKKKTFSAGGLKTQSTEASRPGPYTFQYVTFENQ